MANRRFPRCCNAPGPGDNHCTHPTACFLDVHEDQHSGVTWPKDQPQDHSCSDEGCSSR